MNGISVRTLEDLDRLLARERPESLELAVPADAGSALVSPRDAWHLCRSARVALRLVSHLFPADFRDLPADLPLIHLRPDGTRVLLPPGAGGTEKETERRRRRAAATMKVAGLLAGEGIVFRYPGWPADPLHKRARRLLVGYGDRLWLPATCQAALPPGWWTRDDKAGWLAAGPEEGSGHDAF